MKRRISFAFILMCIVTLLSLTDIIGIFTGVFSLLRNFSLMSAVQTLCRIVSVLTPLAIVVLLYLNRKNDIKSTACLVLKICGYVILANVALSYRTLINLFSAFIYSWSSNLMILVISLNSIVLGILLVCVASSVKNNKTSSAVKVFAVIGLWLGVLLLLGSVVGLQGANLLKGAKIFMMFLGLWCLPKTVCDYENCFFFGRKAMILMVCVVVAIAVCRNIITGDSSKGNCFNCGGTGWDSANRISCVWCGGDGFSSWNP